MTAVLTLSSCSESSSGTTIIITDPSVTEPDVGDVEAPNITSGTIASAIDENSGAGQIIYTATSDDSNATYTLSGADSSLFTINGSTGAVTLTANPDFETQSSYSFTVIATDTSSNSTTIAVTLTINDKTGPTFTSGTIASAIDENSGAGQVIYTATSDDSNATYTLSGADSSLFTINSSPGAVTLTANPDFETQSSYSFTVIATDTSSNSTTIAVTLTINDKTGPTFTSGTIASAIDENSGAGQVIYTAASDDSNATYTLSGADSSLFTINSSTGAVTLTANPDFETQSSYSFTVGAIDSIGNSKSIGVTLDINDISLAAFSLNTIEASSGDIKEMELTWDSAAINAGQSVLYTVCEKDTSHTNNCNVLTSVTDLLTITTTVDSLISALSADYFILASSDGELKTSTENNLTAADITKMIGYIKASNTGDSDYFGSSDIPGTSIALSGDGHTLAVGAYAEDNEAAGIITDGSETTETGTENDSGVVYLFNNNNDTGKWKQTAYVKASNRGPADRFGISVALNDDGTELAVGAYIEDNSAVGVATSTPLVDSGTANNSGAVYLFSYNDISDVWTESAYIKASNTGASDEFGYSLALSADATVLAIGAYQESNPATGVTTDGTNGSETPNISGATSSGAVYLFNKSGGTWSQIAYVKASNTEARDNFGRSLDLSSDGHTLAVGAQEEENGAVGITNGSTNTESGKIVNSGAVYVFSDNSGNWIQTAYIKASNTGTDDRFGHSVSIDANGSTLAVGAYLEDNSATGVITDDSEGSGDIGAEADSGAVYLFENDGVNWTQIAYIKASNTNAGDGFGYDVVLSENGNILAVGAYSEDSNLTGIITDASETSAAATEAESGAVYLFTNDDVSWTQTSYIKASNTEAGDHFGASLALSNDANTIAVGAYGEGNSVTGIVTNGSESTTSGTGDVSTVVNAGAVYVF